jgi:hypothetical protein
MAGHPAEDSAKVPPARQDTAEAGPTVSSEFDKGGQQPPCPGRSRRFHWGGVIPEAASTEQGA